MNTFTSAKYIRPLAIGLLMLAEAYSTWAQAPGAALSFQATTNSTDAILLEWDAPTANDADAYLIVARKAGGTFPTVSDGNAVADDMDFTDTDQNGAVNVSDPTTTYTWTGLDPGTQYEFEIYAYKTTGTIYQSDPAASADAWTLALEPSNHAVTFTASATSASAIDLTFSPANTITNATGYLILRQADTDPATTDVNDGTPPGSLGLTTLVTTITDNTAGSYSDTGLDAATEYHYLLVPFNENGDETYNYLTDGTIPVAVETTDNLPGPSAATNLEASTAGADAILLEWDASTPNGADAYLIVARKAGGTFPTVSDGNAVADDMDFTDTDQNGAVNVSDPTTTYTWTGLDPSTQYEFEIYAYKTTGTIYQSDPAASADAWTLALEPSNHAATFTANATSASVIDLTFSPANTITNATGYIILRQTDTDPATTGISDGTPPLSLGLGTLVTTITDNTAGSYSDTGLDAATEYHYLLVPFNENGDETYNYLTDGTIPVAVETTDNLPGPSAATNLEASTAGADAILLEWDASTPNGADAYLIVARKAGGTFPTVSDGVDVADDMDFTDTDQNGAVNVSAPTTTYTWTGLDPGTQYEFEIYAYKTAGTNYQSANASSADAWTLALEPSPHAATFTATATSETSIELTFSPANTITNATGYIILRQTGADPTSAGIEDGKLPADLGLGTLIATITDNTTGSFSNTGLAASTEYHYLLVPYNENGDETYNYLTDGTIPVAVATTENVPPSVSSLSPTESTCAGETIVITGSNFISPTVTINGVNATIIGTPTDDEIQITAPAGAVGTFPIQVKNSDGKSASSDNYTIKEAINASINVTADKTAVATGEDFYIEVGGNTQTTVTYRVRRISPTTSSYSSRKTGTGGILSFGAYDHLSPGSYTYEVRAESENCSDVTLTQTVTITIAALAADAGATEDDICPGDEYTLGASTVASGGSGYYTYAWTSNPTGFVSTTSNPVVSPTVTTTYTLTVLDSNGASDSDDITINVKETTDAADLDIVFSPSVTTYSIEDDAVDLSFTVESLPGTNGVFSGNGVNDNTKKFYPAAADIGSNDITLTYTNANNCETSITESVNVYDPNEFITGLDPLYCPYGSDHLTVITPPPAPYLTFVDIELYSGTTSIPSGSGWDHILGSDEFDIYLDQLPTDGSAFFRIEYTTASIENAYIEVPLDIREQPDVKISLQAETSAFCGNDDPVSLSGTPVGGIWSGADADVVNDLDPAFTTGENGEADFDPTTGSIGANLVEYLYEDSNGCQNTAEVTITVYDIPTLDFTAPDGCVGIPVVFEPTVNVPATVSISQYQWDFDDENQETTTTLSDPTDHTYTNSNDYNITFTIVTTDECQVSDTHSISVGDIPDIDLTWENVCDGDASTFVIHSAFFRETPANVASFTWDFGDATPLTDTNPALTDSIRNNTYASTGYYEAAMLITTDLGCTQSDTVQVYKVPRFGPINDETPYDETFDGASLEDHGWKTGGTNNSWAWGIPAAELIDDDATGGGKAWVTNLTGSFQAAEQSWVHSPCFDLTDIKRPLLTIDIRSLTRENADGAVLQLNTSGTTDDESEWVTIGSIGEGINWYDVTGIVSNPGNQTLKQTGWSGNTVTDETSWRTATISLDTTLNKLADLSRVRMRIAFASSASTTGSTTAANSEGFAFDNFFIHQRDRSILIENFTNNGSTTDNSNAESNASLNEFVDGLSEEVIKLEYHLSISGPEDDPLYLDNTTDANARAAFYGITETPYVMLDGAIGNDWETVFDTRTLNSAEAIISSITTSDTPAESLNITVTFSAKQDLPPTTTLHIAVIEKSITDVTGANGETEFTYVMRKMLPNALGTRYTETLEANEEKTVSVSWVPKSYIYDLDNIAIIAFLQNEQTREVYQAMILRDPENIPDIDVITGTEPTLADQLQLYPSPADKTITIQFPTALTAPCTITAIDTYGKVINNLLLTSGEKRITLNTDTWTSGLYVLQIETSEKEMARKKIMIIH